jgi:hypothetical protein
MGDPVSHNPLKLKQADGMFNKGSTPTLTTNEGPSPTNLITERLQTFQAVRNPILWWLLLLLPWSIFLALLVLGIVSLHYPFFPAGPGTAMFMSGLIAAALSLIAFQVLMQHIPRTLGTLWSRRVISTKADQWVPQQTNGSPHNSHEETDLLSEEKQYLEFLSSFEHRLNHPGQWFLGLFFTFLVVIWTVIVVELPVLGSIDFFAVIIQYPIGFIVGFMSWRMIVTGMEVWQLGRQFDLNPQLGHPDGCGGMEPLGGLCLWHALIVSIAGIHLGGWIAIGAVLGPSNPYGRVGWFWTPTYSVLLLVPLAYALISFLAPVWRVHQVMVAKRAEVWHQLDQLGQKINLLQRELIEQAENLDPNQYERLSKNLEQMRRAHEQNKKFPVWPFNLATYLKFILSQLIPLVALIVSIINPFL